MHAEQFHIAAGVSCAGGVTVSERRLGVIGVVAVRCMCKRVKSCMLEVSMYHYIRSKNYMISIKYKYILSQITMSCTHHTFSLAR